MHLHRPVVGDGGGHQDDVGVGAGKRLATQVCRRRRRHDLDAVGDGHLEVRAEERHASPALTGGGRQRDAHPSRRAVPEEPDAVERLPCPSRCHEDVAARERSAFGRTCDGLFDAPGDFLGLGHPPDADEPLGELSLAGPHDQRAALDEQREVCPRRRVLPHRGVHRRRDDERPAVRERRLRQEVVRQAVRKAREGVRGQRRDDERVGVLQVGIRIGRSRASRQRPKRLCGHEPLRAPGEHRRDFVARADE